MRSGSTRALADVLDAVLRSGVDFLHVDGGTGGDPTQAGHWIAGLRRGSLIARQRLGEDARCGGLARTATATEQVGVMDAPPSDGVLQRLYNVLLADDPIERLRTVLPARTRWDMAASNTGEPTQGKH